MVMEPLSIVLVLSVMVEVITNGIKAAFPALKGEKSRIIATIIGILLTVSTRVGILTTLNIELNYIFIDYIVTGIVISRGSNAVHDIISIFEDQNPKVV